MQVNEVESAGLKRAYTVVVPQAAIAAQRDKRLAALAKDLRLPGFRPGKVPMAIVKQRYGTAVLGEILEQQVGDASRQVVSDRGLKPALQPKIEITNFAEDKDLEFRMDLEVLPDIPMPDFGAIELERLKAEPGDAELDATIANIAERNRGLEDVAEVRPAAKGDVLVCDFVGEAASEGPDQGPNRIPTADPRTAEPAAAGEPKGGWWAKAGGDVAWSVAGRGEEAGEAYIDLAFKGAAPAATDLTVRFSGYQTITATPGEALWLDVPLRLAAGAMPAGAGMTLLAGVNGADGGFVTNVKGDVALPNGMPLNAQHLGARLVPGEGAAYVEPGFSIWLSEAAEVDFTLRIGTPKLTGVGRSFSAFPGGAANDMPIEVGGAGFIPGFTEQLEGLSPGEQRTIDVAFPAEYGAKELAGREARFAITAKALKKPVPPVIDDEFAKKLGLEDLAALKTNIRESLQREYDAMTRMRLKRGLLDKLSEQASFTVPQGMVDAEFEQIWQRVEADMKAGRLDEEDAGKDEAALKADYRAIAERRIRLGLLLSEIGRVNNVQVSADEIGRAMRQEAARYPGQEQQVMEFFRKNPQAAENLRAPIFEEKVVDFLLELAKVSEKQVAPADLNSAA